MIADLAAVMPGSLAPFASRIAVEPMRDCVAAAAIARGRPAYAALAGPFAQRFPRAEERAIVSFWMQHYFAALIVPALAAAARLGRVLPLSLDDVGCEPDTGGTVGRFRLAHAGERCDGGGTAGAVAAALDALVATHLRPLIEGCAGWSGLSPRVLWCNAGVMLDWAAGELDLALPSGAGLSPAEAALLRPFRSRLPGGGENCAPACRKRRICCLRRRLAGVPCCGGSCPLPP